METFKHINILFLGGGRRVTLAQRFIKSGLNLNINVNIFSYEVDRYQPISILGTVIKGLKWNDKNLFDDLKKVIEKHSINLIISNVDASLMTHSKLKEIYNAASCISDIEIIRNCLSKDNFRNLCVKEKISHIPDWDNKTYPFFIKPIQGNSSIGAQKVLCKEHLEHVLKFSKEIYIKQKYIQGKEFSVDCYVTRAGNITAISPRERLRTAGGEVIVSNTINDEYLKLQSKKIIEKLNLRGPLCLQFILENNTSKLFLMEINTRMGGGIIASLEAGYDICEMMINDILEMPVNPTLVGKELSMKRYFSEYFNEINN